MTKQEAFQVIEDTRPKKAYRGAVIGCGRMGSTIDDEHVGQPSYIWPWAHAPAVIEDKVWRAYGLLRHARSLSVEEAMNLLSGARLGVGLGLIPDVSMYTLNKLLVYAQPAHLAKRHANGSAPTHSEIDIHRASYVRELFSGEDGKTL